MPIKWKQRTSNDWVWVSNGRPNEKYWLGKRKEKSLVFFTSKNGGRAWHLTVSSLSYTLPLPCCVLMTDGYGMTTRLWGHNHTGGACVRVCVCVCVIDGVSHFCLGGHLPVDHELWFLFCIFLHELQIIKP